MTDINQIDGTKPAPTLKDNSHFDGGANSFEKKVDMRGSQEEGGGGKTVGCEEQHFYPRVFRSCH